MEEKSDRYVIGRKYLVKGEARMLTGRDVCTWARNPDAVFDICRNKCTGFLVFEGGVDSLCSPNTAFPEHHDFPDDREAKILKLIREEVKKI